MNAVCIPKRSLNRNYSLDFIRIIATCFIVMTHCSMNFVQQVDKNSFGFMVGNVFDSISRAGVPLFLMISGALLLDENKETSLKDMLRRIATILCLTVIWSIIYAAFFQIAYPLISGRKISIVGFIKAAISGHYHMWYLYMLAGVYLATLFLRCFTKKQNANMVLLYVLLAMASTFVKPMINILARANGSLLYAKTFLNKFQLDFFTGYIAYYLTGWYIVHIGINKRYVKKLIYVFGVLSIALIIGITQITKDYQDTYSNNGFLVYAYSLSIFLLINNIKTYRMKENPKILPLLSDLSFGVYIIHAMINTFVGKFLVELNPVIHIGLRLIIVFVLSLSISYLLSKIPVLKKLIRA